MTDLTGDDPVAAIVDDDFADDVADTLDAAVDGARSRS